MVQRLLLRRLDHALCCLMDRLPSQRGERARDGLQRNTESRGGRRVVVIVHYESQI